MLRVAVVGVYDVAAGATGAAIVAGLVVGSQEPHHRIVERDFCRFEQRDGYASARAGGSIRLMNVRVAGWVQLLEAAQVRQGRFRGETISQGDAAALEHSKHIGGSAGFPCGQRQERLGKMPCSVRAACGSASVGPWIEAA